MGKRCNVLFSSGEESMNGIELRHDDNIPRRVELYKSSSKIGSFLPIYMYDRGQCWSQGHTQSALVTLFFGLFSLYHMQQTQPSHLLADVPSFYVSDKFCDQAHGFIIRSLLSQDRHLSRWRWYIPKNLRPVTKKNIQTFTRQL